MTGTIIGSLTGVAGVIGMLWVYFDSKKHNERIDDQGAESTHVTAISAASETLAEAVNVLIAPLNDSIAELQRREREMTTELATVKAELVVVKAEHRRMNHDLAALIRYVRTLWEQITGIGGDPLPPPAELAHVIWDDEHPPRA